MAPKFGEFSFKFDAKWDTEFSREFAAHEKAIDSYYLDLKLSKMFSALELTEWYTATKAALIEAAIDYRDNNALLTQVISSMKMPGS